MWLKGFIIVHLIVLKNTISSQPLIENENGRELRQTRYEECCPCPGISDGVKFRDQDFVPSQKSSFLRMPLDECPCRSESDNQGSSSIFYPSFLRGAQPTDRSQDVKQEPKPLLRPEVGLASSVLETLKEATDEEYKEALIRDATRTALKTTEPVLLDTEPGASKNSVTIVINPRDSDIGYDAIPEASHAHETRCIHSPLRHSNLERRIAYPRLTKEYLLLPKRKFKEPLHKSLIDMDNSPSNIQENFDVLNGNNLGNKLKINPLLLSGLSSKIDEHGNTWDNTGTKLRTMSIEQCDDLNRRTKLNSSPILTLAVLKNKLRDLSEMRNAKRQNDKLQAGLRQSRFNVTDNKRDNEALKLPILKLPTFDTVFDKQNPLVKNIQKLRDVELLPPRKINIEDVSKKPTDKVPDLKTAGTENKANVIMASKTPNERNSNGCDVVNRSISDEFISEEPKETERKSITSDVITSSILQPDSQEDSEVNLINDNSSHVIKSMCDETEILDSSSEKDFQNNVKTDIQNDIFNINDVQTETADESKDSEPESSNILQKVNQEDDSSQNDYLAVSESDEDDCYKDIFSTVNPINLPTDKNDKVKSLSVAGSENSQRSSLKDDILRKLENLRNTVKSKLAETEFDNFKDTQLKLTTSTSIPNYHTVSEKPVTTKDLQKLSDSLLNQEKSSRTNLATQKETECIINDMNSDNILPNDESYETPNFKVNDNISSSLELHQTDTQFNVNGVPLENILKFNLDDRIKTTLNPLIKHDIGNLHSSEYTCGSVSKERYEVEDEDISTKNEMSSQASNLEYNALRPQLSDNYLRSSSSQGIEVEPSISMTEKDLKKSFQIPSLEEIRQTISNIIDEGQRQEEGFRSIDSDPLNESSNTNLVRLSNTNLRSKLPKWGLGSPQNIQRNSLIPSLNTNSYHSKSELPHVTHLKQLKLGSTLNNRAGIFDNSLGKDKVISLPKPKSALDVLGVSIKKTPTLDKIRDSFNTNTNDLFREVPFQFPISNTGGRSLHSLKNGLRSYADNSDKTVQRNIKDITVGNQGILSKAKTDSNNIFETIARRREDMKEKLQALHIDFNDRLATMHDRLLDQTNLQSINIPTYKESGNILNLPDTGCDKENNSHDLISGRQSNKEPDFFLKSKVLSKQDPKFNSPKNLWLKNSKTFYSLRGNDDDGYTMKQNSELLTSNPFFNVKKLSNPQNIKKIEAPRNNLEKQRGIMSPNNGHIKILFSSSTVTPVLKLKNPSQDDPKKLPLDIIKQNNNHEKKNMVHSRLKAISNAYRTKINNFEDSKHSPSEIIPVRTQSTEKSLKESKVLKNLLGEPYENSSLFATKSNSKPRLSSENVAPKNIAEAKNTPLAQSVAPLTKENQFVTNLREGLRIRLANITPMRSTKANHDLKPLLDTVESPSESLKTVKVLTNPLKENTSYKCTMMCVRE